MFEHRIAYRHDNGEVEGFVGHSNKDAHNAEVHAITLIRSKCKDIQQEFKGWNVIRSFNGLSQSEKDLIRSDWSM